MTRSTDSQRQSLALIYTPALGGGPMPWRFLADHNSVQVQMTSNKDYREWDTIILCLLYTKTSDGAESGQLVKPGPDGLVLTSREGELVWEEAAGGSGCECEIAAPQKSGLAPEGGAPGQVYQVNPEGNAYEWRPGRIAVDSDLTLYVRVDGNDANDGLADSPEQAKATLHGALEEILNYDLRDRNAKIVMGPGQYSPANLNRAYSLNPIEVLGAEGYGTVFTSKLIVARGEFHFNGIRFDDDFSAVGNQSTATMISPLLNGKGGVGVQARRGAHISVSGNTRVQGNFSTVFNSYHQGFVSLTGTMNVSGSLTDNFASAYNSGLLYFSQAMIINGRMSGGKKYWAGASSLIVAHGKDANFLPVAGAGFVTEGGYYKV